MTSDNSEEPIRALALKDAQARHRSNPSLPSQVREWSAHCLKWMQQQNWK